MKAHNLKLWCHALVLSSLLAGCGGVEGGNAGEDSNKEAVRAPLTTTGQGRVTPERHCVVKVQSVKPGEPLPEPSAAPQEDCFPAFSEAISFATKGTVQLPPTMKSADFKEEDLLAAMTPAAGLDVMIGVGYTEKNFTGNSWIFMSVERCGAIFYPTLSGGWDNAISSAITLLSSGCRHAWHYEDPYFKGQAMDCTGCNDMGTMDKRTSSIFWTQ